MGLYTNYNSGTGEIHSSGYAPDGSESTFAVSGLAQYVGEALSGTTHYFASGLPQIYTATQQAAKGLPPVGAGEWSNTTMAYADARTVAQARDQARVRIERAAWLAEYGTFTWDGQAWSADPASAARIRGQVLRTLNPAGARSAGSWPRADMSTRTLSNAEIQQLGEALDAHVEAVQAQRVTKLQDIEDATTVAAVDAVVWV
jgi:hypothetical protein